MALIKPFTTKIHERKLRQTLSWKITENMWNNISSGQSIRLEVKSGIPEILKNKDQCSVFVISREKGVVAFVMTLNEEVDYQGILIEAKCSLKSSNGDSVVSFNCDQKKYIQDGLSPAILGVKKAVQINPENLYDQERSFVFEVDLNIEVIDLMEGKELKGNLNGSNSLLDDFKSVYQDEQNSDFIIRHHDQEFKCHKNILCTRSDYFKVMLAGDYIESQSNSTDVREDIPTKTIKDLLKYMYTGEIPCSENLTIFLLHMSDMYFLDSLKEACITIILDNLDTSTCVSTLVLVDRYLPPTCSVRKEIIQFMTCKADKVVELDDCGRLIEDYPVLAKELVKSLGRRVKEKHFCKYCVVTFKGN